MRIRMTLMLLAAAVAVGISGCTSAEGGRKTKRAMGILPQESYAELTDYKLELRTDGRKIIRVGEGGEVTFALRNVDKKNIRIDEWFSNEPDNVIVYCQPWLTGMTGPDEQAWTELSFDVRRPPIRYPLELMPGNQVLVTKELPFVDKMAISPGAERRFFLKAKLNLQSVSVTSPVSVLIVRPGDGRTVKPSAPADGKQSAPRPSGVKR